MVTVTEVKDSYSLEDLPSEESLREERRRTGRYVATVIAIFVSLFGLYQAMARGTPEYAVFFLPALIMFLYVLWILYASRTRGKTFNGDLENENNLEDCENTTEHQPTENPSTSIFTNQNNPSTSNENRSFSFCRTYSIA